MKSKILFVVRDKNDDKNEKYKEYFVAKGEDQNVRIFMKKKDMYISCGHQHKTEKNILANINIAKKHLCNKCKTTQQFLENVKKSNMVGGKEKKSDSIVLESDFAMFDRTGKDFLQKFDDFYTENTVDKRLHVNKIYDIDHKNLMEWKNAVNTLNNPPFVKKFADVFALKLTHVSFSQYLDQLFKLSQQIVKKIEEEKPEYVIFFIDGSLRKSNTWVALLAWPYLKNVVTHVIFSLFDIPKEIHGVKKVILHPDDMAYSGKQMGGTISFIDDWIYKSGVRNTIYIPVLAYIGTFAKNETLNRPYIHILSETIVVSDIGIFLASEYGKSEAENILKSLKNDPWSTFYNISANQNLIYFDHKLADAVSIPTKMIAEAVAYDVETKESQTFRLIENCEDAVYKISGKILEPETFVVDFDDLYTCPLAFYKTIQYTFNKMSLPAYQKDDEGEDASLEFYFKEKGASKK